MTVEFGCTGCGRAVEAAPGETATCRRCGAASTPAAVPAEGLKTCLACGCDELYRHRDFNQKLGIFILLVGITLWAVLGNFLPMVAAALIDLVLYLTLPDVGICYRCKAHHRDFDAIAGLPTFDLERHEHWKFVKAREEGRIPPRETGGDEEHPKA